MSKTKKSNQNYQKGDLPKYWFNGFIIATAIFWGIAFYLIFKSL